MKSIAVIGHGFVGKAVSAFFDNHFQLVLYDPALFETEKEQVNQCTVSVVCVPTPILNNGAADTSIVEDAVSWITTSLIIIKSTMPPGTTEYLKNKYNKRIVFSPEFGGESSYVIPWWKGIPHPTDMRYHDVHIFGGAPADTHEALQFFKTVGGPSPRYLQTNASTAELVKYMVNVFGAMKVTFSNEFFEIAKIMKVDYDELRELSLATGFIERMHTVVFEDKRGYGGKCFPKDTRGIVAASVEKGYVPALLQQVINSNETFVKGSSNE